LKVRVDPKEQGLSCRHGVVGYAWRKPSWLVTAPAAGLRFHCRLGGGPLRRGRYDACAGWNWRGQYGSEPKPSLNVELFRVRAKRRLGSCARAMNLNDSNSWSFDSNPKRGWTD
jgi:hypothetical protein